MPKVMDEIIAIFFAFFVSIFSPILNIILLESIILHDEYKIVDEIKKAKFEKSVLIENAECWLLGRKDIRHTNIVAKIIIGTKIELNFKINLKPFITTSPQNIIEIIDQR